MSMNFLYWTATRAHRWLGRSASRCRYPGLRTHLDSTVHTQAPRPSRCALKLTRESGHG